METMLLPFTDHLPALDSAASAVIATAGATGIVSCRFLRICLVPDGARAKRHPRCTSDDTSQP